MLFLVTGNFPSGNNFRTRKEAPSALAAIAAVAGNVQQLEAKEGTTTLVKAVPVKEASEISVGKARVGRKRKAAPGATEAKPASGKKR